MSNPVRKFSRLKIFDYEGFLSDRIRNHNIDMFQCVQSLSVSSFIEKEPHKQLRMKRKRKGER